jgi:hypothetical protein
MVSRNVSSAFVATCGALIVAAAPALAQEGRDPVSAQATASSTKQEELVCQTVDRPGSHMKQKICATSAEWLAARGRLNLLRNNLAAGVGPTGDMNISTAGTGFSFQR